jgi:serine/threonine protein kinase
MTEQPQRLVRPEPPAEPAAEAPPPRDPEAAADPVVEAPPPAPRPTWEFSEGDPIAPGRTVLRVLGGGSRYEVFLVWDDRLFAVMVAKCLRPDQAEDPDALRDLRREAEALERLAHPVLVRGFDAVLDGPHPHLLIEHLEGPTLRSLLRRGGPLPLQQLLPLALHVAATLHYMAQEEWVHLDVKPDNIVMGVPPRLIDLSVARTFERAARVAGHVGTDAYMAPEQCDPQGHLGEIGPPADVWGLGATLFHAVAGDVPFPREKGARQSEDLHVRFPQLVEPPVDLPPSAPPALRALIDAALAFDPAARPTAAQLAVGLEPLVAALPRKMLLGRRGIRHR